MRLIGFVGGFLDAVGGGGWGALVASSLVGQGAQARLAIGFLIQTSIHWLGPKSPLTRPLVTDRVEGKPSFGLHRKELCPLAELPDHPGLNSVLSLQSGSGASRTRKGTGLPWPRRASEQAIADSAAMTASNPRWRSGVRSARATGVMVSGLPVRGSNRVTVIRTSHNSTPPADLQCATSVERCPVPGKAHSPWIVCWSCAEYGRPHDPVGPPWRSSGGARHSARDDRLGPPMPQAVEVVK